MAREYRKIKRIINNFADDISDSESSDTFSVMLGLEDDRLLKYAPKQFNVILQGEEKNTLIYSGPIKVVDLKISGQNKKIFNLDIPLTAFYAHPYGSSTERKIELEFKGISSEMENYEFITTEVGGIYSYYGDEIFAFEVDTNNMVGILPGLLNITIEEGGD